MRGYRGEAEQRAARISVYWASKSHVGTCSLMALPATQWVFWRLRAHSCMCATRTLELRALTSDFHQDFSLYSKPSCSSAGLTTWQDWCLDSDTKPPLIKDPQQKTILTQPCLPSDTYFHFGSHSCFIAETQQLTLALPGPATCGVCAWPCLSPEVAAVSSSGRWEQLAYGYESQWPRTASRVW